MLSWRYGVHKLMLKFHELYGLDNDPRTLHTMNYLEALWMKVHWAEERRDLLQNVTWHWRPFVGVNDCIKAIKHNKSLIYEYKEDS